MRRNNPGADFLLGEVHPVLDKGFVQLVDYWGDDATVVEAARVSYGREVDVADVEGSTKLINYLMKHDHGTPFEQCGLAFNVKAPIFVFREWHRHRTSHINEISGRYTVLPEEYYVPTPERVQMQSKNNKQGSGEACPEETVQVFQDSVDLNCMRSFATYKWALEKNVAKELARIVLPVNTYSQMRWSMDLRNLLGFLRLRTAPNAQYEIRMFANAIAEITRAAFPIVYAAWEEYVQKAVTLSRTEIRDLIDYIAEVSSGFSTDEGEKIMKKLRAA